jgi:UDPglucose 6-dehydrogenase
MNIGILGTGYVGLVTGACLADSGNYVTCADINKDKINLLNNGGVPIYEPGLDEIIERNIGAKRLFFTDDIEKTISSSDIIFIAVGTPSNEGNENSVNLSFVEQAFSDIWKYAKDETIVVMKSTVPVGTHHKFFETGGENQKGVKEDLKICFYVSNPEFLKEGSAINDFIYPDRIIIGCYNFDYRESVVQKMRELYSPFMMKKDRIIVMDPSSAEMTKYAANAMLATRISFMNEIARLCDATNANVDNVRKGISSDSRIGPDFLFPGIGYGGSCFPKDVKAIINLGEENKCPLDLISSVHSVNKEQSAYFINKVVDYFKTINKDIKGCVFSVWGLAFKANTDDVRESPAIACIKMLVDMGVVIRAYDPVAIVNSMDVLGSPVVYYEEDKYEMLDDSDALLVLTDWQEFRSPDFDIIRKKLNRHNGSPVIFDGRNLYHAETVANKSINYISIGRQSWITETTKP